MAELKTLVLFICMMAFVSVSHAQGLQMQQAQQAFQHKKYQLVIALTSDILNRDSLKMQAYQLKSSSYMALKEPVLAQKTVEDALRYYPDAHNLRWLKAESFMQQGLIDDALPIYQKLLGQKDIRADRIRPRIGMIYQLKGDHYYRQNKFERSETYLEKAKKMIPDSLSSYSNMGLLYLKQKKWQKALNAISEGLAKFPDNDNLMRMRATALYNHKDYGHAINEFKKIYEKNPNDIDTAIQYAQILLANGQKEKASNLYEKLFKKYPDEKKVYESLANYFQKRGDSKAERGALQKMRSQFPSDGSVLERIAKTYERQEKWTLARAAYDTLQTMQGESKSLAFARADTYIKQDSLQGALAIYNQQLKKTNDADVLKRKGSVQEKLEQWLGAKQTYEKLTEVSDSSGSYARLARAELKSGQKKAALSNYNKAIERKSDSPDVYLEAAKLNLQNNEEEEAFDRGVLALNKALTQVVFLQNTIQQKINGKRNLTTLDNAGSQAPTLKRNNRLAIDAFQFVVQNFSDKEVLPVLEKLQADYPGSGQLLYMISGYYTGHHEETKSIILLKRSVQLSPNLAEAQITLGNYYKSHHQKKKALLSYERALSADPAQDAAYRELIHLYRAEGQLNQLCNRWTARYEADKGNHILREYLIEALQKADRFKEAKAIIENK